MNTDPLTNAVTPLPTEEQWNSSHNTVLVVPEVPTLESFQNAMVKIARAVASLMKECGVRGHISLDMCLAGDGAKEAKSVVAVIHSKGAVLGFGAWGKDASVVTVVTIFRATISCFSSSEVDPSLN